ncbi:MAG: methylated-DNA--[protein]-cysteine S-methyltransferase [Gilvibacter sp.]
MEVAYIQTPFGTASIHGDEHGLQRFLVEDDTTPITQEIPETLQEAAKQVQQYFNKQRTSFDLKLNPQGTDFQKRVWTQLLSIPYGKTTTYLEMAQKLGDPKCIRAAASANGKNPLWIIVPCHRVIGSDGSLTGYAGGLWRKQKLLEHEGMAVQQRLF